MFHFRNVISNVNPAVRVLTAVRVWRQQDQRSNLTFVTQQHTVINSGEIRLRTAAVDTLMTRKYVDDMLQAALRGVLGRRIGDIYHQNQAKTRSFTA